MLKQLKWNKNRIRNNLMENKNLDEFMRMYKVASKLKWSKENFATYIGLQPHSLRRKIDKLSCKMGMRIRQLSNHQNPLTDDMIDEFTREYTKIKNKVVGVRGHSKVYLITSAQNATPIHTGFLKSCLKFCEHRNAELLVIPYRYKNPTSLWTSNNLTEEWWADSIAKYIVDYRLRLANNLVVMGEIKIQPTASDPLSGFEGFSGIDSIIVGHPKVRLKSVATIDGNPKLLLSTGSITLENYTDSKIGHKAKFHHTLAATVVEIDEDNEIFHIRQVHGSSGDGSFYDLNNYYHQNGYTTNNRIEALITGDTHAEFIDPDVEYATYRAPDSIVNTLKPKKIILHDVLDFYRRNHHTRNSDYLNFGKHKFAKSNVQEELQNTADFIDRISKPDQEIIIVKSNHDEAFDRWLAEVDPKIDPENAELYYYMKYHQYKSVKQTSTGFEAFDPFKFWCHNPESGRGLINKSSTKFLKRDESYKICGVEVGMHGDVGINGARGDIKGLSKLSDKIIVGHSHTPAIFEGVYMVGLSARKNLEYKRGFSSWLHSHAILYPNGKKSLVHIIDGKWKA